MISAKVGRVSSRSSRWVLAVALCAGLGCVVQVGAPPRPPGGTGPPQAGERPEIPEPNTRRIERMNTVERAGWTAEFYRNYAYTCSDRGYHTFALIHRGDLNRPRPLWVRLHGGGSGYFEPDGSYLPDPERFRVLNREENLNSFERLFEETGLVADVRNDDAGFRVLIPGMCDHDSYLGIGEVDAGNPNRTDENGNRRAVDGLLALRAAVEFADERAATDHVFLHGTSSGSLGAMGLVVWYGLESKGLSGAVLDSGVMNPYIVKIVDQGCTKWGRIDMQAVLDRIGPFGTDSRYVGNRAIREGRVYTPLAHLWNTNDHQMCGQQVLQLTADDGKAIEGEGQWIGHHLVAEAIEKHNPAGRSLTRRMCIEDPEPNSKPCDGHGSTKFSRRETGGDQYRDGEDINAVLYEWVREALNAPPPSR